MIFVGGGEGGVRDVSHGELQIVSPEGTCLGRNDACPNNRLSTASLDALGPWVDRSPMPLQVELGLRVQGHQYRGRTDFWGSLKLFRVMIVGECEFD